MNQFRNLTDQQLEAKWQYYASMIQETVLQYYKTENEKLREKAESYQSLQADVQNEITRRHKIGN